MAIKFNQTNESATFYSPLEDFDSVSVDVEIRADPLTGEQTRIVPESFLKPESQPDISSAVDTAEGCFFCPDSVEAVTPKYDDFVGYERGKVGESTSFPNLNPYGKYSNVIALTADHYVPIAEFSQGIFEDGFRAAVDYANKVCEKDSSVDVASINMNYLRPAGSSIVHPHLQTLISESGTNYYRRMLNALDRAERPFWSQLVEGNREHGRFIGTTGTCDWIAPFAPRHHWHVRGISEDNSFPMADDQQISEIATGITNVLNYYSAIGLNSYNFACYLSKEQTSFPLLIDIIGRSVFEEYYWSDSPFFTVLHDEAVIDTPPEEYAQPIADEF